MKKLIIVLMVVAVASFLFVGCIPTTPVTPVTPVTPTEPTVAKTETPYITEIENGGGGIISLSSTITQYSSDPKVSGVGVAGAVIKVYINDDQSGVGTTALAGTFGPIPVSLVTLKEGVKKVYVTATVPGLAESDKSTEYTFTYDITAPKIASAVADSGDNAITVTFNEAVNLATATPWPNSALNVINWELDGVVITGSTITKVSTKAVKIDFTTASPVIGVPKPGTVYVIACKDIADALGNKMAVGYLEFFVGITVK